MAIPAPNLIDLDDLDEIKNHHDVFWTIVVFAKSKDKLIFFSTKLYMMYPGPPAPAFPSLFLLFTFVSASS